ncbi:MAG: carbon starvation CstA family protein [bacterium]
MNLTVLSVFFLAFLVAGYFLYGRWVARQFDLNDSRVTPANTFNDGIDFVPTQPFYLFSQHFSAIAAAGPIAGPILAAQAFGWLPALLWIMLGVVLIGAVHDFSSLIASVRHKGTSIAEIAGDMLGTKAGLAMMAFIWLALIYVIVAFADITAGSFVGKTEEMEGMTVAFNKGGAVAAAAIMYLLLSIILGLVEKYLKPPLWLVTVVFVPLTLFVVWLGTQVSTMPIFLHDQKTWGFTIMLYCFAASLTPVWVLLQPRGYLGGFVLFLALALGLVGIFSGHYVIHQPAIKGAVFGPLSSNTMFPMLFVTIACGACSGFHGLVCSGTTSKQIDREGHCHAVGYGAMLAEGFVAFIALVTIMMLTDQESTALAKPAIIYGNGIGEFMTLIIGPQNRVFAITFGAMAFSTFVFDTLDVCTRLGRYLIQELTGWKGNVGAVMATALTIAPSAVFLATAGEGSYLKFWALFGASNQLLAALTLLSITVWLYGARKRIAFTLLPMLFVLTITLWALVKLTIGSLTPAAGQTSLDFVGVANAVVSLALIGLAIYLVVAALAKLRKPPEGSLTLDAIPEAG